MFIKLNCASACYQRLLPVYSGGVPLEGGYWRFYCQLLSLELQATQPEKLYGCFIAAYYFSLAKALVVFYNSSLVQIIFICGGTYYILANIADGFKSLFPEGLCAGTAHYILKKNIYQIRPLAIRNLGTSNSCNAL